MPIAVEVLIPTCGRPASLAVTLVALLAQDLRDFAVIVSDQTEAYPVAECGEVAAVARILRAGGIGVEFLRHLPRRGMAEQRQFLLERSSAPHVLFIDDDVVLEPDMVRRLHRGLLAQRCGFIGAGLIGLSYIEDVRPHQHAIEFWDGPVEPEVMSWRGPGWERHRLHNAANLAHVAERLGVTREQQRYYKVAWVGGCVMYDRAALVAVGGFDFWRELPPEHCGEDVLAQWRVMARFAGCGVLPSGAYHMELPTTVPDRRFNAPELLPVLKSSTPAETPGVAG